MIIKTQNEIELMAQSGKLLASVFTMLDEVDLIGKSTMQINDMVEDYIINTLKSRPASKGQYDYEYVLNCSINDVVCHGVPSDNEFLKDGDIVNFDITLEKNGFITDSSKTYLIGNVAPQAKRLVRTTYEALLKAIKIIKPGASLGDIGFAIESHAKKSNYSVVREYCGHGIGREMHEEPNILHYGKRGTGLKLKEGMVFTIEPMINQGTKNVKTKKDGWTVVTADGKLSAQFEHTIAVTNDGYRVLTLRPDEAL